MENRLSRIDGLRGIAIIGVMLVHSLLLLPNPYENSFSAFFSLGQYGVAIFFLVSGYIIAYIAQKNFNTTDFYIKRFFRLAPLYYLFMALCLIFNHTDLTSPEIIKISPWNLNNFVTHITFLHGLFPFFISSYLGVMWSLTPEIVFYLFFPLINKLSDKFLFVLFIFSFILSNLSKLYSNFDLNSPNFNLWLEHNVQINMFLFLFGILMFRFPDFFKNKFWACVGIFALSIFFGDGFSVKNIYIDKVLTSVFHNKYFACILLSSPLLFFSGNKLITFVGKISYSAFFIHWVLIQIFIGLGFSANFLLMIFILFCLTIVISFFMYKYVEQSGIRFGKRFLRAK